MRTTGGFASGSGFVYDYEGRIITNSHVVDNAVQGGITVTFVDGTIVPAVIVGTDPYSDVAVIDVDLSASLLAVAAERIVRHGWQNAKAVEADATTYRPE